MKKKFFIIAGEASGDVLGAKLMAEIGAQIGEDVEFYGVGGKMMEGEGLSSLFDMNELSVMGFAEILPHIFKILRRINQVAAEIIRIKPDYVITIDSPDFNFRVMKKLCGVEGFKKVHFIAPSVWAYREGRAQKISKFYDLLLAILPFEPPYFTKYGLRTVFVGHPIVENVADFAKKDVVSANFRKRHGFYEKDKIIYVTPGSRISEVSRIFVDFIGAINLLKDRVENLSVVVAVTDKTRDLVARMAKSFQVKYVLIEKEEKNDALFACDFSLAKSGTNTLESSLYRLPMVVCYKVNNLTYLIAKMLVKVKFVNLVNLILNKEVIPELLQFDCHAEKIAFEMSRLINNPDLSQSQLEEGQKALKLMGMGTKKSSTKKAIEEVLKL